VEMTATDGMGMEIDMKMILVKNKQHSVLPDQARTLAEYGWTGEVLSVPMEGWSRIEMEQIAMNISTDTIVIFLSPVPGLMCICSGRGLRIAALHNDKREAVERRTDDGSVIMQHKIAAEGWEII
jgi:hypothetical protein